MNSFSNTVFHALHYILAFPGFPAVPYCYNSSSDECRTARSEWPSLFPARLLAPITSRWKIHGGTLA